MHSRGLISTTIDRPRGRSALSRAGCCFQTASDADEPRRDGGGFACQEARWNRPENYAQSYPQGSAFFSPTFGINDIGNIAHFVADLVPERVVAFAATG
jgi:hypothetical protein